jgi:hypothetical protein
MRAVEREEGGQPCLGVVESKDGGRPSAVESVAMEHGGDSRVGSRMGAGAAAIREESEVQSFFYYATRDSVWASGSVGLFRWRRGPPKQASR